MSHRPRVGLLAALLFAFAASGCATTVEMGSTPMRQAQHEVPPSQLVDVGIEPFDPGIPLEGDDMIFPEVRRAESRFIPYHLKHTLQQSGHWGSVWMVPEDARNTDLLMKGEILDSDGEVLELKIQLADSAGRLWLDKTYRGEADITSYDDSDEGLARDPFQDVYNRIANDMLEARDLRSAQELEELRTISQLRFASDLAPDAFRGHLEVDEQGLTHIKRLPSLDDPMLARVERLRERDYMLMDTLNEHYAQFYSSMNDAYRQFREFNYEEVGALRSLKRNGALRMTLGTLAVIGGVALIAFDGGATYAILAAPLIAGGALGAQSGYQLYSESTIHAVAIQELGRSFESDVTPRIVEVQGRTLKLKGSAETQYRNWKRILYEIYQSETGLAEFIEVSETPQVSSGPADATEAEPLTP